MSNSEKQPIVELEEMVQSGMKMVLKSFGKGEDLEGAVTAIVMRAAKWGAENAERKRKASEKKGLDQPAVVN